MYVKLVCLFCVVLAADGASLSGECRVKNPIEPDLDKLSGLWHVVGTYPEGDGLIWSSMMEYKRDGANYTVTLTFPNTVVKHINSTHSEQVVLGVDEKNRKVLKLVFNHEHKYIDGRYYLLAAEYDKFSIVYDCFTDLRVPIHELAIVMSRSKEVEEDTRNKIRNVLLDYPQFKELKDKFD